MKKTAVITQKNLTLRHRKSKDMHKHNINIRPASKEDSPFIAYAVAMAIGDEEAIKNYCGEDYITLLTLIAESDNSQYSYRNTLIAETDSHSVGAVIGYDGAKLHELRSTTYSIIERHLGRTPSIPDETEPGEFYLDSLAVIPEQRKKGIGRQLIKALRDKAFSEEHKHIGLIVDFDNPRAEALYTSLGFTRIETKTFLGHKMWHMQAAK